MPGCGTFTREKDELDGKKKEEKIQESYGGTQKDVQG
jgi:hypothetical protein